MLLEDREKNNHEKTHNLKINQLKSGFNNVD